MSSRPRRARYTQAELDAELLEGMEAAKVIGERIAQRRCDDEVRRVIEAFEDGRLNDGVVEQLRREMRGEVVDRLMDLADSTGVTPMGDAAGGDVGDDAERWLSLRDDYLRALHEDERAAGRRCTWECWRCEVEQGGGE